VACGYAFDKYRFRHKESCSGWMLAAVMVPQDGVGAART